MKNLVFDGMIPFRWKRLTDLWLRPWNSHMGLFKNHQAGFQALEDLWQHDPIWVAWQQKQGVGGRGWVGGACLALCITRGRGWRGRTLIHHCGFSWWPLPGSWRCRWPVGGKAGQHDTSVPPSVTLAQPPTSSYEPVFWGMPSSFLPVGWCW